VNGLRKYEVIFILRPDLDEEKNTEVIEKFKTLIESHGGEILKLDKWGKRKLAYEVKKFREGLYVLIQMKAESKVATELDRVFKITDEVLRHMIIREDE
jgi:small subunit ribosomal protein S6